MEIAQPRTLEGCLADCPGVMTPADVAGVLQISAKTVRRYMREGQIPRSFHVGPYWYVTKPDFIAWIEGRPDAA